MILDESLSFGGRFEKSIVQGRKYGTIPIRESFGSSKARISCQNGSPLRRVENDRYDFRITAFQGFNLTNTVKSSVWLHLQRVKIGY